MLQKYGAKSAVIWVKANDARIACIFAVNRLLTGNHLAFLKRRSTHYLLSQLYRTIQLDNPRTSPQSSSNSPSILQVVARTTFFGTTVQLIWDPNHARPLGPPLIKKRMRLELDVFRA